MIQKNVALRKKAGGNVAGAINYLLQDKDSDGKVRQEIEIIDGDASSMIELEKTMSAKQTYHSSVLAFTPEEMKQFKENPEQLNDILKSYKNELAAGLNNDGSRLNHFIVKHGESDGSAHFHVLTMKKDLATGKHYEPFNSKRGDISRLNAWNSLEVHKHNLVNPNALERQRTGSYSHNLPKIAPAGKKLSVKEVRDELDAFIQRQVETGRISNREEVISTLNKIDGLQVQPNRSTKSISIRADGYKRNIRLQGVYYGAAFTSVDAIREEATARATEPIEDVQKRYTELNNKINESYGQRFRQDEQDILDNSNSNQFADNANRVCVVQEPERKCEIRNDSVTEHISSESENPARIHDEEHRQGKSENPEASRERGRENGSSSKSPEVRYDNRRYSIYRESKELNNPSERSEPDSLRKDDGRDSERQDSASLQAKRTLNAIKTTDSGIYYWQIANTPRAWACKENKDGSLAVRGTASSWRVAASLAVNKGWSAVEITINSGQDPKIAIAEHMKLGIDVAKCSNLSEKELTEIKEKIRNEINNSVIDRRTTGREKSTEALREPSHKFADAAKCVGEINAKLRERNARIREDNFSTINTITHHFLLLRLYE